VWEANHTWLIFCLVLLWSGFPTAFSAIMTTLYIPLGIAAFGIVLRGAGFAFRKVSMHTAEQRLNGIAFAGSSVITPYCFGAVAGGIASGRVPTAGHGDPMTSWLNPTSVLGGILAVLTCGYLAAVFLTAEAHRADGVVDQGAWSSAASGATGGQVPQAGAEVRAAQDAVADDRAEQDHADRGRHDASTSSRSSSGPYGTEAASPRAQRRRRARSAYTAPTETPA
jgi:cytochrome d ubiquinol oxidase subunit II